MAIQAINTHMQQVNTATKTQAVNRATGDNEAVEARNGTGGAAEEVREQGGARQQANTVYGRENIIDILA